MFGGGTGRGIKTPAISNVPNFNARFLSRVAADHFFQRLAVFDDAGYNFQGPGFVTVDVRSNAKLFDRHHFIADRIVGQDKDRVPRSIISRAMSALMPPP